MCLITVVGAQALSTSHFANSSRLATGKWVKITIPEDGVYEITYDELSQMGFATPANVRLYGQGGGLLSEILDGSQPDDLLAVPVLRQNNKIIFYGKGATTFKYAQGFERESNGYDTAGYYFLTEQTTAEATIATATPSSNTKNWPITSSIDYCWHEKELSTLSFSGRQLLGEDITVNHAVIDYYLPKLCKSDITIQTVYSAMVSGTAQVTATITSGGVTQTIPYDATISAPGSNYVFYRNATPKATITLNNPQERGTLDFGVQAQNGPINSAKLDYFIITYRHTNAIDADSDNQLRMGFITPRDTDLVSLPGASATAMVWNVDNPQQPVAMKLTQMSGARTFAPAINANYAQYVAFDPARTLKKVATYANVDNQNLHAMEVPEMLIITNDMFMEQAQRIARMHEQIDNMKVAVINQKQVFNEFSSGACDPMAVRLLCKMLYDRDKNTFKHLLMMGNGTYDNRNLLGTHDYAVVNYETNESDSERNSYTTDDFFGFLLDGSGVDITSDKLCIGVGRITCKNPEEAQADVDKLIKYVSEPDYGVWRNNIMLTADDYDEGMHMAQAEGVATILNGDLGTQMQLNKVYCTMFPRAVDETLVSEERRTAKEAKRHLAELSQQGQYFATYVGHAGPNMFTKMAHMWTKNDVQSTRSDYYPIWTTACCDVARYDSDQQGIADLMFHKPDGGAIAILASTRAAYASSNDELNRAFVRAMFSYKDTGIMPTLGETYKQSKLHFAGSNSNKLVFALLGDPAIKVEYPKPDFQISKINGKSLKNKIFDIYPMQEITIEAQVMNTNSSTVNTNFTGDAYLSLYGHEELFDSIRSVGGNGIIYYRNIYKERELIAEVKGRVERGTFIATFVVPRYVQASAELGAIRVYAHQDGTHNMVNGFAEQVRINPYDPSMAVSDTEPPVIESIYFNDENSFGDGSFVASNSILYVRATDNCAINTQSQSVGNSMKILLDNGKTSDYNIKAYAHCSNNGKQLDVAFPVTDMTDGQHKLTFTVYDVAGNATSRTIHFVVGQDNKAQIKANDILATRGQNVDFNFSSQLGSQPQVTIKVTDAQGHLVWNKTSTSFPVVWNMKNNQGQTVPCGSYRYFATYSDGINFGGTPIERLIIVDPVKN